MMRRRRQWGFTLLEMMIAMAILSGSLTWIVVGISRNIKAENHAKLMTTATFLARQKISELEDQLYETGFSDFDSNPTCTFDDRGFARFTCAIAVDKVELPSQEQLQTTLTKANEIKSAITGQDPAQLATQAQSQGGLTNPLMGMGAGALA